MPSKSLASRKRPPRSSWTRSIWRVISTAWVTPRYRTPVVVHVVTIVSRRANAMLANLRATYKRREDVRRMYRMSDILRTSFGRPYNLVLTSSTIYSPTLKYQQENQIFKFLKLKNLTNCTQFENFKILDKVQKYLDCKKSLKFKN